MGGIGWGKGVDAISWTRYRDGLFVSPCNILMDVDIVA